ncbi:MAG TPA: lipopolysaccharide heptosyltransferase II [Pyrinomonadaceae bacterium]|nr:lipopolysaccharide heptosyltransferase II [Pyrinomonadaceae bacterium]
MKTERLQPDQIHRVVVRVPNWVGDAVMSVPALRELRRLLPEAQITLVSRSGAADIFIDAAFVDEVLIYDRAGLASTGNQIREWRLRKFDLALLFQNAFEAAAIAFLSGTPTRMGYDTERRGLLLTHSLPSPSWKNERHESFYYLHLVAKLEELISGSTSVENSEPRFDLDVSEDRKRKALRLLHEHGAHIDAALTVLCPGSINSRAKRWPAERYAKLADRLAESGADVVLIGSPTESDVSQEICKLAQRQPIVLTGKTTVAEAAAIISIADVLIANDTGPAHIGAALHTPTLVIFGPTNPLTTYPFSSSAEIVRRAPDCAPCMLRDCPIDHRCMTAITPEDVFVRASVLMSQQRAEVTA